jgi:hypothetical protein
MGKPGYTLINVLDEGGEVPFPNEIGIGDHVKLGFEFEPVVSDLTHGKECACCGAPSNDMCSGEHMWVKVTEIDGEKMKGWIDNVPWFTSEHGLNYHDEVEFTVDNVEILLCSE